MIDSVSPGHASNSIDIKEIIRKKALLFGLCVRAICGSMLPILLFILYRDAVAPAFDYMGFVYISPEPLMLLLAIFLSMLIAMLLPSSIHLPSDLFVWLFYSIVVVPMLVLPLVSAKSLSVSLYLSMVMMIVSTILMMQWMPRVPMTVTSKLALSKGTFWLLYSILLILFLSVLLLDYRAGLTRLLSLTAYADIYSLRFSFREQTQDSFFLSPYFLLWLAKVMIPLLLAKGIEEKKVFWVLGAVFLQLLMFSVSGHKSFILSLFLVLGVFWLLRRSQSGTWFIIILSSGVILSALLFYVMDNELLVNVVVRRALMVPGILSGFYFEYFNSNGAALYSHNFLVGLTDGGYEKAPAFEIGSHYFGREETSSNVHFWADAYANIGFAAVFVVSVLVSLLLLIFNALWRSRSSILIFGLIIVPFWTLHESSLNTTLFSHGLLLALILAVLLPPRDDQIGRRK